MKGTKTKDLILDHARELFLEFGYEGVSMRMLASRCSISLGLIYQRGQYQVFLLLITKYRRELRLLLMHAEGSPYEHYEEEFVEKNYQQGKAYLRRMGEKYPQMNTALSEQLIKINVENWLHLLKTLLDERLNDSQRAQVLLEYFTFTTAGWERVMRAPLPKMK